MIIHRVLATAAIIVAITALPAEGGIHGKNAENGKASAAVSDIIEALEQRYAGNRFSADFHQESTLSALDITDTAEGKAWFEHPGKMRWEYYRPDEHAIITDGETLWVHRPNENQVIKGDAATYFGGGKGAGFLANFKLVTEDFDVRLETVRDHQWNLQLIPLDNRYELSAIHLAVNRKTKIIEEVTTENIYGDTTRISFHNMEFDPQIEDGFFRFEIPDATDVIHMEE